MGRRVALLFAVVMWVGARDWRYGVVTVGALSTWLPWLLYDDRPIFFFYAIATLPFIVIALTLAIGKLIGPSRLPSTRRTIGVVVTGAFVVLVLVNFAWFWPIWTNGLLTRERVARPDLVLPLGLARTGVRGSSLALLAPQPASAEAWRTSSPRQVFANATRSAAFQCDGSSWRPVTLSSLISAPRETRVLISGPAFSS